MPMDPAELTSAWFEAWRTRDAGAIERMSANDYVYVGPNGNEMSRDTILEVIRDPTYRIIEGGHTDVEVRPLSQDVTLVRHHWKGRGTFRGQVFDDNHRCVMVWHRVSGEWRVRYEQASPVAP